MNSLIQIFEIDINGNLLWYYLSNNDYEMAKYIVSHNYLGHYYPSLITIDFQDLKYAVNRLRDDQYFAQENRRIKELEKDLVKPDFEKSNNENFHKNDKIEFKNMDKSQRGFDKNLEKPERVPANSKIVK